MKITLQIEDFILGIIIQQQKPQWTKSEAVYKNYQRGIRLKLKVITNEANADHRRVHIATLMYLCHPTHAESTEQMQIQQGRVR